MFASKVSVPPKILSTLTQLDHVPVCSAHFRLLLQGLKGIPIKVLVELVPQLRCYATLESELVKAGRGSAAERPFEISRPAFLQRQSFRRL